MNGCPDREKTIWLYLLQELPEEQRRAFSEHLNGCPSCRAELRRIEAMLEKTQTAGGGPRLSASQADAMVRGILDRVDAKPALLRPGWLTWPKLVPSLAAACAMLLFVGIFSYRALEPKPEAPLVSEIQTEQALSPNEVEMTQDMELLLEFQTVQKLVRVLDGSSPEEPFFDNDNNALRDGSDAMEAYRV